MKKETKIIKKQNIFKGVNKESSNSILYLLKTFTFKQAKFYVLSIIFTLMFFMPFIVIVATMNDRTSSVIEKSYIYSYFFISLIMVPVIVLSLFSISDSLSKISSTTLIKRIGSTRLNEKGYVLIVLSIYYSFAFITFFSTYIFWMVIFLILGAPAKSIFSGNIVTIIYVLLFIMLMVSTGVFIGVQGIGQTTKGIISVSLFVMLFIFSSLFIVKNDIWTLTFMPSFIRYLYIIIVFSNPWIIPTIFIKGFFYNGLSFVGPWYVFIGFVFVILGNISMVSLSMATMSFTKIN